MNKKLSSRCKTPYKGVYKEGRKFVNKPYCAKITLKGKQKNLGRYATASDAAKAYDQAAIELHGDFACTNKDLGLI